MRTTPNLLIPFPELSDPANVPADMERLAMAVDTSLVSGSPGGPDIFVRDVNATRALYVAGTRLAPPFYGTAPPVSPFDGQEWYLLASQDAGVMWRFRYRPDAPAPHRWEFVGGPPYALDISGNQQSVNSRNPTDLPTPGPILIAPRAGDYVVRFGAGPFGSGTSQNIYTDLFIGGAFAGVQHRLFANNTTVNLQHSISRELVVRIAAAGTELRLRFSSETGVCFWNNRSLSITPIRVS
jgi:hypothetical protein